MTLTPSEHEKKPKRLSELEETFALQLRSEGIKFEREFRFDPNRKWRADFRIENGNILVDLSGGIWMMKSGHNTAKGIQRDYEKANAAQMDGFMYLQFSRDEVDNLSALDTIKSLLYKCAYNNPDTRDNLPSE